MVKHKSPVSENHMISAWILAVFAPSFPAKAANHEGWTVVGRDGLPVPQARDVLSSSSLTMSFRLCSLQRLFDWDFDVTDALLESRIMCTV